MRDEAVERALRTGEQLGPLEDLFGAPGLEELRLLAREAQTAGIRGGDRVLILPGIMGSKLGYAGPLLFDDTIWVDPADIALGRLSQLRLNGGASAIQALGVMLFAYLALKLRLRAKGTQPSSFRTTGGLLTLSAIAWGTCCPRLVYGRCSIEPGAHHHAWHATPRLLTVQAFRGVTRSCARSRPSICGTTKPISRGYSGPSRASCR